MSVNDINLGNLHKQAKPVQFVFAGLIVALLVVVGYFALIKNQWDELTVAQQQEEELRGEYKIKAARAANLENLKLELAQIEASIEVLLKKLPTSAEIHNLIQELHQAAAKNGLVLSVVAPQRVVTEGPIQRLPHEIQVNGNYEQIAQFARDVGQMSRIVTLSNLSLRHENKSQSKLVFSASANTYKAVDVSETEAMQSATN